MGAADEHRKAAELRVRVAVLTASDTRTVENDESGRTLREGLTAAGHEVVSYAVVRDEPDEVQREVRRLIENGIARVVVTTGGTGITARDTTYEALDGLLEKRLDGFGELFRALSYEQIGAAAMMSRAVAGTYRGGLIVALPGSADAVRLALEKILVPELAHLAKLAARRAGTPNSVRPAPDRAQLSRRTEALASDVGLVAKSAPELLADDGVMRLYEALRAEVAHVAGDAAVAHVPPADATSRVRYAELAIYAGQLAAITDPD
jgi:molybdenum cofactor biosynthesis protein B